MAAAQSAGIDGITKVLESICRERRRENLDKESEGKFNICKLSWSNFKFQTIVNSAIGHVKLTRSVLDG